MREILFRGKTLKGDWVEGFYYINRCRYAGGKDFIAEEPKITTGITEASGAYGERVEEIEYKIIPETVGQYTGLTDKNGKKIFEGDIVVCSQEINGNFIDRHIEIGYVEMKHGAFGLHRKRGYYRPFKDWLEDYEYEVIGNIHDYPDFLKGE
jgi:uncharacterized phage protein (TIGR01671 family)